MARHRIHLIDESPTRQEQQIASLGGDLYDPPDEPADEPAYGADPLTILLAREEEGETIAPPETPMRKT